MSANNIISYALCAAAVMAAAGCGAPNADDVFRDGAAAYDSGDYAAARKKFGTYAKLRPESDVAAYNLGMANLKLKNYRAAANAFERADSLAADNNTDALEALAQTLRLMGKPDDALAVYDRAIAKAKRKPAILAGMAQCNMDKGQFGYAQNNLLEILRGGDEGYRDPIALFNLGVLYTKPAFLDHAKAGLNYYNFLRYHRDDPEFAAETVRAAQALAALNRTTANDDELNLLIFTKLAEAEKFALNPVKRISLDEEAWRLNPANQNTMITYARHANELGGVHVNIAREMLEILALVQQY